MPQAKLNLTPGINTQATQTGNEGSWSSGNLIRWKDGYLEKLGGWQRLTATQLAGLSRGLHAYQDLNGNDYLASGAAAAFQIYTSGTIYTLDIFATVRTIDVPSMAASTLAPHSVSIIDADATVNTGDKVYIAVPAAVDGIVVQPGTYTVDSGSGGGGGPYSIAVSDLITSTVVDGGTPPRFIVVGTLPDEAIVRLENHGYAADDTFTVNVATTVGAISLFGPYRITSIVDANMFVINVGPLGYSTSVSYHAYELQNAAGDPQTRIAYATSIPANTANWSIDNFGSALLACYQNGPLLAWNPPIGAGNLALQGIPGAPSINTGMFVAMPQAQVIAFGSDVGGLQDPLLVRFSDAGNYTGWTASATNQAGSYRLSRGSGIIGGIQAPDTALLWTDIDLWSMKYVGTPLVYSFNIVQTGCGLIAQRARCALFGQTYWMSQKQFFTTGSGGVSVLPCPVWDEVFGDLDEDHLDIIWAESNAGFGEIMFFFASQSGGTGEIDKYAKYNVFNQLWDYGFLERTAGIDQSVFGSPIMIDANRRIQQHEIGYDDDNIAMSGAFIESGFLDIGEGDFMQLIQQIIPDFKWFGENGSVTIKLFCKNYPSDNGIMYGPYTVNSSTRFLSPRIRARQIAFRIEFAPVRGYGARLGATRYLGQPAGKRP